VAGPVIRHDHVYAPVPPASRWSRCSPPPASRSWTSPPSRTSQAQRMVDQTGIVDDLQPVTASVTVGTSQPRSYFLSHHTRHTRHNGGAASVIPVTIRHARKARHYCLSDRLSGVTHHQTSDAQQRNMRLWQLMENQPVTDVTGFGFSGSRSDACGTIQRIRYSGKGKPTRPRAAAGAGLAELGGRRRAAAYDLGIRYSSPWD
jgi:hypothetical protein